MTSIKTKLASGISAIVIFASAAAIAGLGFAVIATLAMFAFIAIGVSLIAAPFLSLLQPAPDEAADVKVQA